MYLCADHSLPHSGQVGVALGEARAQVGQVAAEVASDAPRQIVVAVRYEKQMCILVGSWNVFIDSKFLISHFGNKHLIISDFNTYPSKIGFFESTLRVLW